MSHKEKPSEVRCLLVALGSNFCVLPYVKPMSVEQICVSHHETPTGY